jgi:hypothetical protein
MESLGQVIFWAMVILFLVGGILGVIGNFFLGIQNWYVFGAAFLIGGVIVLGLAILLFRYG